MAGRQADGGRTHDISIYGQESNYTTWRLAKMNLAIRGIGGQIAHGDSFHNDRHVDLKADFILANPPFNVSEWGGERLLEDGRWRYGVPPKRNANFAWVEHMVHHLAPKGLDGRYVGVEPQEDDGEPFEDKMARLVAELREQQAEGARLDAAIAENLAAMGFGGREP